MKCLREKLLPSNFSVSETLCGDVEQLNKTDAHSAV